MIFDSDILIEFLGKNPAAAACIESVPLMDRNLSAMSYLEVLYGCRNRRELHDFQQFAGTSLAEVVPISESISHKAVQIMEGYVLASRLDATDALIAATALVRAEPLATGNVKHFDFIAGLELKAFRP
ncbi:MAG: type II toxin-antitoxin system VapC family toxin [Terriglobia bacterium]